MRVVNYRNGLQHRFGLTICGVYHDMSYDAGIQLPVFSQMLSDSVAEAF